MTHDVTVSAAECGKCNGDIAQWTIREKESWVHMVHFEHLKAQKDALWQAAVAAWTQQPNDNVIAYLLQPGQTDKEAAADLHRLEDALRAQREAMK